MMTKVRERMGGGTMSGSRKVVGGGWEGCRMEGVEPEAGGPRVLEV
jgi:hypothetical protein